MSRLIRLEEADLSHVVPSMGYTNFALTLHIWPPVSHDLTYAEYRLAPRMSNSRLHRRVCTRLTCKRKFVSAIKGPVSNESLTRAVLAIVMRQQCEKAGLTSPSVQCAAYRLPYIVSQKSNTLCISLLTTLLLSML